MGIAKHCFIASAQVPSLYLGVCHDLDWIRAIAGNSSVLAVDSDRYLRRIALSFGLYASECTSL